MRTLATPLVLLFVALLTLAQGCARQPFNTASLPEPAPVNATPERPAPQPGDLFWPDGAPASLDDFQTLARSADYVLLAESHTSACDHLIQARLLQAMADAGLNPVLGLEMVAVDRQDRLDRFNAGDIDLDELPEALDWADRWGHAYELYRPVLETAREIHAPLFALNLPPDLVRAVSRHGAASLDELDDMAHAQKELLPAEVIPPSEAQRSMLKLEFQRHVELFENKGMDDEAIAKRLKQFYFIQSLWDTTMAQEAVRARKESARPVAIILGTGHAEYGWGLAHRLKTLDPLGRALIVVPWRGDDRDPEAGDLFFYCPLTQRSRLGMTLEWSEDRARVTEVQPGSPACAAGLLADDLILSAQGMEVESLFTLHKAARKAAQDDAPLLLEIERGEEILELSLELPESPMPTSEEPKAEAPDATTDETPGAAADEAPETPSESDSAPELGTN